MMSDNNNQESSMDDSMSVSPVPGQGYALRSGAVARQIPPGVIGLPMVQYPIDNTLPVKAWVFEIQPSDHRPPFKPLRPEDERKAIEAINRHLPPSERIEITQPSNTGTEVALNPRPRHKPGTSHSGPEETSQPIQRRYHGTHLPLPPRSRHYHDRHEAVRPPGSHKNIIPAQVWGMGMVRGMKPLNLTEMEDEEEKLAWREQLENRRPNCLVPGLHVTLPDGETRYLADPNLFAHIEERGNLSDFW